jgi:SpoVK/Ycf46/Vps4 family AAA+-type ATPase
MEGEISWSNILMEEVYEAFAETGPEKQREELVQVAAVAVEIIEYLDRKKEAERERQ